MRQVDESPNRFLTSLRQPWSRLVLIMALSLGGLLAAITVAGFFGLTVNQNIQRLATAALDEHTELEEFGERGEEVRIAVIEVRHDHKTLITDPGENLELLKTFDRSYANLIARIDYLDELNHNEPNAPTADELRAKAEQYYSTFRPAFIAFERESPEMKAADTAGLALLDSLDKDTEAVDRIDELRAKIALSDVQETNAQERFILLLVLGGLGLAGAALGWSAYRVVGQMRTLYHAQQDAAAQLTGALNARTVFIADASHELRTPLTVLKGNAELGLVLERDCSHEEILKEIVHESDRMTRLVENLLFLARSDADSVPLKLETFSAETFARGIATRAEMLVHEQGARFAAGLTGRGTVTVDQGQIEQAVMILIDNAAKYGQPGGDVRLNASTEKDELIIEVADNGPGIPQEALPHLFERFTRVDKARSRSMGGAGLGLAIAKTIVEAHRGTIEVESHVGEGTRMRIHLPLSNSDRALRPSPTPSSAVRPERGAALGQHRPTPLPPSRAASGVD